MLCLVMLCRAGNAIVGRAVRAEVGPFTMPVFGAGLASALLHEPLRGWHAAGIALILVGLPVTAEGARRRVAPRRRWRDD